MRITESRLRRIIREELLSEARKLPPVETFLRFGDPRAVKDGVSVIHDPIAYAYAEEPALYGIGDGESYNLRSEAGISAYPVVEDGNTITFKVGNGIGPFSGQLGNFLLDRLMAGDVWVFKARRIPSMALGTDSEPLIDGSTVRSVRKVDTSSLRVTDRSSGGGERLLDLLDPWDLDGYLNMGYNEFFKTQDIPREKITDFLGSLKARFSTPKQLRVLEKIEEIWLDDWDEDHLSKSGRGIAESRLHKLLREAAMTPRDAAKNGITFEVQSFANSVEISAFKDGSSIATLEAEKSRSCDAWPVSKAFSGVRGLGPLLYDLLMDIVHPEPITSDRELVTPAARAVWEYYFSRRPDIEKVDLPEKCPQDSAERHLGDDLWRESPLSKGYKRPDESDYLVLGALRKMGIIEGYD